LKDNLNFKLTTSISGKKKSLDINTSIKKKKGLSCFGGGVHREPSNNYGFGA